MTSDLEKTDPRSDAAPVERAFAVATTIAIGTGPAAVVVYASFGQRLGAWVIDAAILGALRFALLLILGLIAMLVEGDGGENPTLRSIAAWLFPAVLYLCAWPYYALSEASRWQGTPGKRAMGLQVDDIEGGRASLVQTSVRFFLRVFSVATLGIGFLLAAMTRRRQAMHDIGANCVIVRTRPLPMPRATFAR